MIYRNAHGKEPRGFGSWAFQIGDSKTTFWCHQATYGDAKKAAKAEARRLNFGHVVVLS